MMNVLIVDDEVHCAEGVKCAVNWAEIGVDEVYTAYSMKQAQEMLDTHEIQIILCDVEMPKGSGLELLQWVREQNMSPVSILLTSYAKFQYAKQALELGCMDYMLKPVTCETLEDLFSRAVKQVEENRRSFLNTQMADYWKRDNGERGRRFFKDILEKRIAPDDAAIKKQAQKEHLVWRDDVCFLPVLLRVHRFGHLDDWGMLMFALNNILQELLFEKQEQVVFTYGPGRLVLIVEADQESSGEIAGRLLFGLREYRDICRQLLQASVSCYVAEFKAARELADQFTKLTSMDQNNVAERPGIYARAEKTGDLLYERPDFGLWTELFTEGKYEQVLMKLSGYLDGLAFEQKINREVLTQLFHDFIQAFYVVIDRKGVQAHLLFQDEESVSLFGQAVSSLKDFKAWAGHLVKKAASHVALAEQSGSVVSRVKMYIRSHLEEELSRNQLAEAVYLSPDYLSRVFRLETGIQLSEYITQERIREAKRLLLETELSIGDVSFRVGYNNWAYFSKVFKSRTDQTPAQFRLLHGK